jgi:peptide methionine sulfoxide reductase MsrB
MRTRRCGEPNWEKCPKCGSHVAHGFGLAGGGYGPYRYCTNPNEDACDFFDKTEVEE